MSRLPLFRSAADKAHDEHWSGREIGHFRRGVSERRGRMSLQGLRNWAMLEYQVEVVRTTRTTVRVRYGAAGEKTIRLLD